MIRKKLHSPQTKARNTNVPEVMAPFQYEDLTEIKLL